MNSASRWLPSGTAVALDDGVTQVSFDALHERIDLAAAALRKSGLRCLATLADNSVDWLVADLAMLEAGVVHVPLPAFFTPAQVGSACATAGAEAVLIDPASPLRSLLAVTMAGDTAYAAASGQPVRGLEQLRLAPLAPAVRPCLPKGTAKITFTSGSTGTPKGVCLGSEALLRVVAGVDQATRPLGIRQHLCALPLAVLLENVAGALVALAKGATVHLRTAGALGWRGAAGFDAALLDQQTRQTGAESIILMPQMLRAWTTYLAGGHDAPPSLLFAAVGGAAVGARTILEARAVGLPAFEGYGLSEGGSVQTLNLPGADRLGSVGRPLPHALIQADEQSQLLVGGSPMLAYVGQPPLEDSAFATGDVGTVDADGFVWVRGRRDNLIITGLGRNVSPEWVESVLRGPACVAEAIVLPEREGGLRAVVWPASGTADHAIDAAIAAANHELPDYARIAAWTRACRPLDAANGLATASGKPLRAAIAAAHPEPVTETTP